MIENIQIRLIVKKDNAPVAQLIRSVMTDFGAVGEGYSINDPELDTMYESYTIPKHAFWVIEKDGTIQGCGGIAPLANGPEDTCELRKMYFYSSLRGLGLGRKLLEICLDQARKFGYNHCYLETLGRMARAGRLYEKAGFKPLEKTLGNTGHSACDRQYILAL